MVIARTFGTHDGLFHADEVTACALLLHFDLIERDGIVRTRDKKRLSDCEFVCDVGGVYDPEAKRFDHHQVSYLGTLSSAGMVWLYLKERKIVDADTYRALLDALILGVDDHDNGRVEGQEGVCTFSKIIANFVPIRYDVSKEEIDAAFSLALDFVSGHISRFIRRFAYTRECKDKVRAAMEKGEEFLLFDEAMPWMDGFFELGGESHPAQFVVMPSGGHWKLRGIPPGASDRMKVRKPLPAKWAGLLDEEFKRSCPLPGAVFCHKGRFISVWETKEDVLRAVRYVLEEK